MIGRPKAQFCKRGHDTFVCGRSSSSNCKECLRLFVRKSFNRAKQRKRSARWFAKKYATDPIWREKRLEFSRVWRRNHKEAVKQNDREYFARKYTDPIWREKHRAYGTIWKRNKREAIKNNGIR